MPPNLPKLLRYNLKTLPITIETNYRNVLGYRRLYRDDKLLVTLPQSPDSLLLENTRNIQGPGSLVGKKANSKAQKYREQRAVLKNAVKELVKGQVQ